MSRLRCRGPRPCLTSCRPRCLRDPETAAIRLYRRALTHWWELTAHGPDADHAEIARLKQEIYKLIDEVGEPAASTLCRQWARARWRGSGLNPWSGQPDATGQTLP